MKYLLLATLVFIAACSENEVEPLKGEFIYGPTSNLSYKTATYNGLTDDKGMFNYADGESVSFSYGGIELGSTDADETISPKDFVNDAQHPDTLLNILRFLQTLDTDDSTSDAIVLPDPESIFTQVKSINFSQSSNEFEKDINLLHFLNDVVKKVKLVDEETVLSNFETALEAEEINVDTDGDGVYDVYDVFPNDANETQDTDGDGIGNNADTDDDGDGIEDTNDLHPLGSTEEIDSDEDGIPDDTDTDVDGDTVENSSDNCPVLANADQADLDGDGVGDLCDSDYDGDGINNEGDNCPMNSNADQLDSDKDNVGDVCDQDVDGDKVAETDNCPTIYNPQQLDLDKDGIGDSCDSDIDGDKSANDVDNCPVVANASQADMDSNGIGDACDFDIDGDKFRNDVDNCPLISNADQSDFDGDGVGDDCDGDYDGDSLINGSDNCPLNANKQQEDMDSDGIGDICDPDMDGDGHANDSDDFADNPAEWLDTDGDGIGNNADDDDDNDGTEDINDDLPLDDTETVDTDGDGIGNNADTDDDGDGVIDSEDAFPLDIAEWLDSDGDGMGDNEDDFPNDRTETVDTDGDGVGDNGDAFHEDPLEWLDTDEDGIGNNADPDDDNDGVLDENDAFPLDDTETVDTDGDGVGDNADAFLNDPNETADTDGDGMGDNEDAFPSDANETIDTDGDGTGDNADTDDDGDTYIDSEDAFPLDPTEWLDSDGDGIGDNADPDAGTPQPSADSYIVDSGSVSNSFGVLDNDSFGADGAGTVAIAITVAPVNGSAVVNDNGTPNDPTDDTIEYDSNTDYTGSDSLTYSLTDATGSVESAIVSIRVNPVLTSFTVDNTADPKVLEFSWDGNALDAIDHFSLLVNDDGSSGFTIVSGLGAVSSAARSVELESSLHLLDWDNAQYRIEARDEFEVILASAELNLSSLTTDGPFTHPSNDPIGMFKASNMQAGDRIGSALAISLDGMTMVASAPDEDSAATGVNGDQSDNNAVNSGAVYVFAKSGSAWTQQAYLKASNTELEDNFGASVALSSDGNTLVVGAPDEDNSATGINSGSDDSLENGSGAVYVFVRSAETWSQQAYIKASNTGSGDEFGGAVALSDDGNTLVVGAFGESSSATGVNGDDTNNTEANSGAAYVFTRSGSTWSQHSYLKASNTEAGDLFGAAVDIAADGLRIAVSATHEDSDTDGVNGDQSNNDANFSGAVYLFESDGSDWSQTDYLKASNSDLQDEFGSVVSFSGDAETLAVSAIRESSSAEGVNGDQSNNDSGYTGAVYLFEFGPGGWSQTNYIKAESSEESLFGTAMAISNDGAMLAVGSPSESNDASGVNGLGTASSASSGAAYIFTKEEGAWSQKSYIRSPIPRISDYCGEAVGLSSDGSTFALGCRNQGFGSAGISTDNDLSGTATSGSGAVFLY